VIGFRDERDACRVMEVIPKRFGKNGLTVHPTKTKLVRFRPPSSRKDRASSLVVNETGDTGKFDLISNFVLVAVNDTSSVSPCPGKRLHSGGHPPCRVILCRPRRPPTAITPALSGSQRKSQHQPPRGQPPIRFQNQKKWSMRYWDMAFASSYGPGLVMPTRCSGSASTGSVRPPASARPCAHGSIPSPAQKQLNTKSHGNQAALRLVDSALNSQDLRSDLQISHRRKHSSLAAGCGHFFAPSQAEVPCPDSGLSVFFRLCLSLTVNGVDDQEGL
jgi:hypothetical protein